MSTINRVFHAGFIRCVTHIDPWFLQNIKEIVEMEEELVKAGKLEALV